MASTESVARQVERLRQKNWSEAKIKKWLEATSPRPSNDAHASRNDSPSVNEWATFLDEALRVQKVPYVGLIGHWYRGNVLTDSFTLASRVSHTVADLRDGRLGILGHDVIHEFQLGKLTSGREHG